MSKPVCFGHPLSNNARTVEMTLVAAEVDYEFKLVDLLKGEHKTPEFLAINPSGAVPALKWDDKCYGQSMAICRMVAKKAKKEDELLGTDDAWFAVEKALAAVTMDFIPLEEGLVFNSIAPKFFGMPADVAQKAIDMFKPKVADKLKSFEDLFYKESPHFLVGSKLSLADCMFAPHAIQLGMTGDNFDLEQYPKLKAYLENMASNVPAYQKAHEGFNALMKSMAEAPAETAAAPAAEAPAAAAPAPVRPATPKRKE